MNTTHLIKELNTLYNLSVIKNYIKSLVQIIIDSLFPVSDADKLLFSYSPQQALKELPKATKTPIDNTYSIFAYKNELATRLIWNIKYKKNIKAVKIGGFALYEKIINDPSCALRSDTSFEGQAITNNRFLIIPIPITQKRRNERGFNQCEFLVDEILKLDKTSGKIITSKDLLIRTVHKDRQTLKSREERLEDAKNIFVVNQEVFNKIYPHNSTAMKNLTVIVIDDVITTGSTMKEAIETLRSAGFSRVIGISLAH
jgi:ComF family protein